MKPALILVLLLTIRLPSLLIANDAPPGFVWTRQAGGTNSDEIAAIANDSLGNAYVAGTFRESAKFGTNVVTAFGYSDIFVAKYDSAGQVLAVQSAGGPQSDYAGGIVVALDGSVYVTGSFQQTGTFGPTNVVSFGSSDMFLAKYNANLNLLWVRHGGTDNGDSGWAVAVDDQNNAVVTGRYNGYATFGDQSISGLGNDDMFVVKYSPDGQVMWLRQACSWAGTKMGRAVAVDRSGSVYVSGNFSGTVHFGDPNNLGGEDVTTVGNSEAYLVKYDRDGNQLWVQQMGGPDGGLGGMYQVGRACMNVDSEGFILLAGSFLGQCYFSRTNVFQPNVPFVSSFFLAKYDSAGRFIQASFLNSFASPDWCSPEQLAVDSSGNSYIAGAFWGILGFNGHSLTNLATNSVGDKVNEFFLAKYSPQGECKWARTLGAGQTLWCAALAADPAANLYWGGYFWDTVTFGGTTLTTTGTRTNRLDAFLTKLETTGPPLQVARSNGLVELVWPAFANGFHLEESAALCQSPGWQPSPGPYATNNGLVRFTLLPTNGASLYRLQRP